MPGTGAFILITTTIGTPITDTIALGIHGGIMTTTGTVPIIGTAGTGVGTTTIGIIHTIITTIITITTTLAMAVPVTMDLAMAVTITTSATM